MAEGGDKISSGDQESYQRLLLAGFNCRFASRNLHYLCKQTMVGSMGSCTNITGSDCDILMERPDLIINESILEYRPDLPCYAWVPASRLPADTPAMLLDGGDYMRADWLREKCEQVFKTRLPIGDKSKVGNKHMSQDIDMVPQIRIDNIPRTAQSFTTRDRSWPCADIVKLVSNGEFHLTARPAPCEPDETHDFCLSFAKAEVVLTKAMSANQVKCIVYMKIVRPYIDGGRGVLTSYHMKTVSLWYFEQADNDTWENDRPVTGILEKLDQYLQAGDLPHYFVSKMNLFVEISSSDLVDIRRRLHRFLGISLIAHDVTGIGSHTRLLLSIEMMDAVNTRLLGSQQSDHRRNDGCQQSADKLYMKTNPKLDSESSDVNILKLVSMSKEQSDPLSSIIPVHLIKADYVKKIGGHKTKLNEIADQWVRARTIHDTVNPESVRIWMGQVRNASVEPLETVFRMDSTKTNVGVEHHDMSISQQREHKMDKWMTFTDEIIARVASHAATIVDKFLSKMPRESLVSDGYNNVIGGLLLSNDHVTSDLLSSATRVTETFTPPETSDAVANLRMLKDAMERMFIPVEYAIVKNIRSEAVAKNLESSEYKCLAALIIVVKVIDNFDSLNEDLHRLHGWLECNATTIRSPSVSPSNTILLP